MDYFEKLQKRSEEKIALLEQNDKQAKEKGQLVGRYIEQTVGDGSAYYVITKELKNKVDIEHVDGIWDDYFVPYWGAEARIEKDYAEMCIRARDGVNKLFA